MKIRKISYLLLFVTLPALSQENEPESKKAGESITDKFPTTRVFDVQYEQLGSANYDTEVFGDDVEKATVKSHSRLKIAANIPLYRAKSQRFFITNSLRYKREGYDFGNVYNVTANANYSRPNQEFHYLGETVSATYFSQLFKKPVIYNASVTVDGNEKAPQRVKGLFSATLVLKRTASTTMTLGAVALLDPSSIIPFAPVFTYEHQFKDSPWKLDIIIPQRILIKRKLLENGRLSLGTELNSENFYIDFDTKNLNGMYELNQLELKSGLTYEYSFFKNFIGTLKTGVDTVITSRVTERGKKTSKYVIESKQDAQFYFNLGVSYNPF
ncbi:DUF6268 family outer membrane beta-barrel protein [Flavobacterium subsaxonicum]|uniref:Outer membrane protein beta-barrel domain-containing protein n=1 Tax=Flavobacterium subsaxonicum WB 4.1-42 = DSM 21790 TaxID=1121898 RepID=A0A0A2MTY0_9FLAO|nr:hypothetical protein [Flavobacterium subsaxonicum]KGO94938.1 hypothetical protein Q766_02160 [Flavobacterium subsaxonicum WB 4.1-42 = DSM 21790]